MEWLYPWRSAADQSVHVHEGWAAQLKLEVCSDDPVYGIPTKLIGHGQGDDAVFQLLDGTDRVAFVHLHWGKSPGRLDDPFRTRTCVYDNLEDFFRRHILPEHEDHLANDEE